MALPLHTFLFLFLFNIPALGALDNLMEWPFHLVHTTIDFSSV